MAEVGQKGCSRQGERPEDKTDIQTRGPQFVGIDRQQRHDQAHAQSDGEDCKEQGAEYLLVHWLPVARCWLLGFP